MQRIREVSQLLEQMLLTLCSKCRANKTGKIISSNTKVFIADEDTIMLCRNVVFDWHRGNPDKSTWFF